MLLEMMIASHSVLFFLGLLLAAAIYSIMTLNRLQSLRNGADAARSQIRAAMKKRLDSIEQFMDSGKNYASFERQTLEKDNPDEIWAARRTSKARGGVEINGPLVGVGKVGFCRR
jgi:hypothetical protein